MAFKISIGKLIEKKNNGIKEKKKQKIIAMLAKQFINSCNV